MRSTRRAESASHEQQHVGARRHVLVASHRIEALADGVFAVAMTLLVIELKLADAHSLQSAEAVQNRRAGASAA